MRFRQLAVAIGLCVAWSVLGTEHAEADLVLAFAPTGSLASANVAVNSNVDIPIYLRDDGVALGDPSKLSSSSSTPLIHFSVLGTLSSPQLALNPPPPSTASFTYGPAITSALGIPTYTPAGSQFTATWAAVAPYTVYGDATTAGYPLLLGTVHLKALALGTYTLSLNDPNPTAAMDQDFQFGTSLSPGSDADVFGADYTTTYKFTVNVSAVPEPGSMSLVALTSGGLWLARRRWRRAK